MGRDFSYLITYENTKKKDTYHMEFDEIMRGNIIDGRNQWDGPASWDEGYTRQEIIDSLKEYVEGMDPDDSHVRFTLRAFGHIIYEMSDDQIVYIHYG